MAKSILGDINPVEPSDESTDHDRTDRTSEDLDRNPEADESMVGGSQHDRARHAGSRDVRKERREERARRSADPGTSGPAQAQPAAISVTDLSRTDRLSVPGL
jgi:hypothetical protein